jgi:MFS family permease
MSAQAIGGIAGGVFATLFGHRFSARTLLGWGAIAFGALDLALFLYPLAIRTLWPAPILMVIIGLPGALLVAGLMTVFQTNTEDGHRGRVFGAAMALEGIAMLGGTLAAGALGGHLGIVSVIAAQGAGYVLAGAVVLATLPRPSPVPLAEPSLAC